MADPESQEVGVEERLDEIADLLDACRQAFLSTAKQFHWEPAAGSAAEHAAVGLPSPDPAIPDPIGETGHRLIAEVVSIYLLTASGHLGALASLYRAREVHFSPPALIRAVIENCAHAVWVLGPGDDEKLDDRLARAYLEELLSAEEACEQASRLHRTSHRVYKSARAHVHALDRHVRARFNDVTVDDKRRWTIDGQTLPGPKDAVAWMYVLTKKLGGTVSRGTGVGVYGLLSNRTHPTLYPARQRRVWVADGPGHNEARISVDIAEVERDVRVALAAYYNALTYVSTYFDWPNDVLDVLDERFEALMPTFFLPEEDQPSLDV